ncbi:integrase arm-type DNA-binding domain-containing protein [Nitrobacter sp.]|uniref:tyrosine-type recombinase/integrase n=1 Tax=Nitrobacter sp. TaxID=29420 RepID=UPI001D99FB97|nr:integrase arm-type DNA-binding domain-containing protein [Nitrobacter sp.]MCB1394153.1 integrase arm-type DNA-binding domain-containing protein [Nitrobacter sp.]MCV0387338.1 integrase arm-type DNA-binding domain-containing protein [Nitrobacter sp.]
MLTDTAIRKARAGDKPFKLADSGGLHLYVSTAGGKLWRFRYSYGGKEKLLSIGPYPSISLLDARAARDAAKATLREGRDPGVIKKLRKLSHTNSAANTFEAIAREWYDLNKGQWVDRHAEDVITSLEREVFPTLGDIPVTDIKAPEVLAVLRGIETRAKETARRVRQRMSAVFVYAISSGRAEADPAATVQKAMAPMRKGRQPAITDLDAAQEMLAKAEAEKAHPATKLALRILALSAVRPGTLITTPWSEWADLDDGVWRIPAARMKLRLQHKDDDARDHLVPLSRQAFEAIEALRTLTGGGPLAFPNTRHAHKPMSENAIGYLLNRAGYHHHHVPHGWRATFSSVMNERFPADKPVIDLMLAHVPKDKVEGAYNRALHLERRRELAQNWADLILEGSRPAATLLAGPRR